MLLIMTSETAYPHCYLRCTFMFLLFDHFNSDTFVLASVDSQFQQTVK